MRGRVVSTLWVTSSGMTVIGTPEAKEHPARALGVHVDVELGGRRDIAHLEIGPAHQDDLLHTGHDVGRAAETVRGDVRQRPEGAERDGLRRRAAQRLDQEIDGMAVLQGHGRLGQRDPVETGLAMDVFRRDQRPYPAARPQACKDADVAPSGQFADDARVSSGSGPAHVAGDRR